MVAKYQTDDQVWCDVDVMCRNEEVFYNQVVPFFRALWQEAAPGAQQSLDIFPR